MLAHVGYSVGFRFEPHWLIISLGNPGQYYGTLHSAGHFALAALQKYLVATSADTPMPQSSHPETGADLGLTKATRFGQKKACWGWEGHKYTLLQCPTQMNVSGSWAAPVWSQAMKDRRAQEFEAYDAYVRRPPLGPDPFQIGLGLIILHDELEDDFGVVKSRWWSKSHRGHNGVRDILPRIYLPHGDLKAWRISVGIGRPTSRTANDVARHVLSPLSDEQKEIIDLTVPEKVMELMTTMELEWRVKHETVRAHKI